MEWAGSISAHIRFHRLHWGLEASGINNLILGSFDLQATREAAEAILGPDRCIRSHQQAAAEQVLQDHNRTQHRVDLTLGMTQAQRKAHEQALVAQGRAASSLDWTYNFNDEHLVNPVAGCADDGTAMTKTRNISLGDTAYDVVEVDDDESNPNDFLTKLYGDKDGDTTSLDIQMEEVHCNTGRLLDSRELSSKDGGLALNGATPACHKHNTVNINEENPDLSLGSGTGGPGQAILVFDFAKTSLCTDKVLPAQDQDHKSSTTKELDPCKE
jgi:hypothetical protein